MTSLSELSELTFLKQLLKELGHSPQKSFGQNFLINETVINKIVNHFDITGRPIVEIGPGLGALTRRIKLKTDDITLLEIDKNIINYWLEQNEEVIAGDALKFDWSSLSDDKKILISNLPYQISASLVVNLSSFEHGFQNMVLMFQKEVAQRITASPDNKNFGILSVLAQNIWNIKKVADLSLRDFYPSPKIASRVLAFERKPDVPFEGKKYLNFVKHSFQNRRKLLMNKVVNYAKSVGVSKEQVHQAVKDLKINEKARAENLSAEQFLLLYREITK